MQNQWVEVYKIYRPVLLFSCSTSAALLIPQMMTPGLFKNAAALSVMCCSRSRIPAGSVAGGAELFKGVLQLKQKSAREPIKQ